MTVTALPPEFYLRLLLSTLTVLAVVLTLYVSTRRSRDVAFSYLMFGLVIFLIAYVLKSTEVSVGFGFGLFAVFGILRYRTEEVPTRDLTYLLVVIAIAMINAVANFGAGGLLLFNALLASGTALVQWVGNLRREEQQKLVYERVELIRPARRQELLQDLQTRLGVTVERIEVGQIDFMRDTVLLTVWSRPQIEMTRSDLLLKSAANSND
jgi:Domain of unknown function (DUF4956)